MGDKGRSNRTNSGGYIHYDGQGHRTGRSDPRLFGGYDHYDTNGHKTGHSEPGFISGYTHYDSSGRKTGRSEPALFGGMDHYDSRGRKIGHSDPGLFGDYSHNSDGCYVATCVYGSYDCPEVWTLRRFRDNVLKKSAPGRLFVRAYYAVSPRLVERCGGREWFTDFWRRRLDALVLHLRQRGFSDAPYRDKKRGEE